MGEEARLKKLALEEEKARQNGQALELQRVRLQLEAAKGNGKYFLEALRILQDERLDDRAKVARAMKQLENLKEGAIEVEGEVKKLEMKTGS